MTYKVHNTCWLANLISLFYVYKINLPTELKTDMRVNHISEQGPKIFGVRRTRMTVLIHFTLAGLSVRQTYSRVRDRQYAQTHVRAEPQLLLILIGQRTEAAMVMGSVRSRRADRGQGG